MQSYSNLYTYASQKTSNSHRNYVTLNYENYPTIEPTEYVSSMPSQHPLKFESNNCVCKIERNNESNILIIATSITSSLCVAFFFNINMV